MLKRIWVLFFVWMFCFPFTLPTMAENDEVETSRLVDDGDLLSESKKTSMLETLNEISERLECDVIIVTVWSLDGKTAEEYADDFYDNNGYGMGADKDGILLFISRLDREWAISTCGYAITVFSDYIQEYMSNQFVPMLSKWEYSEALNSFAELCDFFLTSARNGNTNDTSSSNDAFSLKTYNIFSPKRVFNALLIGAALALIITGIMWMQLKSVRKKVSAADYIRANGLNITKCNELFLYDKVDKRAKPQDTDSSNDSNTHKKSSSSSNTRTNSSSSSKTHTSSSGRTHGGSSGKF